MIKKTKLFWSFDIKKTEIWLEEKSREGFNLKNFNYKTGSFYFEKGNEENRRYQIIKNESKGVKIGKSLKEEGYVSVCSGKWEIVSYDRSKDKPKLAPSRESLKKRNITLAYSLGLALLLSFIKVISTFLEWTDTMINFYNGEIGFAESFKLSIIPVVFVLAYITVVVLWVKTLKNYNYFQNEKYERRLIKGSNIDLVAGGKIKHYDINALKDLGLIKSKYKLYYHLRTVETEKWLEKMERLGYNLCNVTTCGKFQFVKGEKRDVKYIIDFNFIRDVSYEDMYRGSGWNIVHKTGDFMGNTIWAKECSEREKNEMQGIFARCVLVNLPMLLIGGMMICMMTLCFGVSDDFKQLMIEGNMEIQMIIFNYILPVLLISMWIFLIGSIGMNMIRVYKKYS